MEFKLETEFIELIKLLKLMGVADSGGEAKEMVDTENVKVNGKLELRRRYKVRKKDIISANEIEIKVV